MEKYYIYKILNKTNAKVYIGKAKNPKARWEIHISTAMSGTDKYMHLLHRAIVKYGQDNFDFSIIEEFQNEQEAFEAEKYWIDFYRCNINKYGKEAGYNMTDGGEGISGYHHTEETRQKIGEAHKGLVYSEESKNKMSNSHRGVLNNNHGKHLTEDHKNNISSARKLQGNFRTGTKHSEETKKRISAALKNSKRAGAHE